MHNRENALNKWLLQTLAGPQFELIPLTGDASFRRYFRLQSSQGQQIVMDAPPEKERLEPFLTVADLLTKAGIRTPQIQFSDISQGFAILEDFGDTLLFHKLSPQTANHLYKEAITTLINIQQNPGLARAELPIFNNEYILQELQLFREWFLSAYLKLSLSQQEETLLNTVFGWLSDEVAQQPQVFIHRDYHSRNIMLVEKDNKTELGIIDFQDAMRGPCTYDLVSLLKDCYIQWPAEQVHHWLAFFYEQLPLNSGYSLKNFTRAFELCGLQRHLKVLGIFSRLYLRDNKRNYLQDLPRTLNYVRDCLGRYEELHSLSKFMQQRVSLP